jgi:MoaA/NifB/PqqE/SkfB family radical SAM enzyme
MNEITKMSKQTEYLLRRIDPEAEFPSLLAYPKYVELETVNACNARCPMCTIDDWQRKSPTMKDDLFLKIADDLGANASALKRVSLYRDGEPLLDKKMAWRISELKRRGIPETAIATNAQLLTEKKATELLESGLDLIIFSIDSLKKEVFEKIRARLDFETVIENTKRFIELRDKGGYETKIWIRMIRQQDNFSELEDYLAHWTPLISPFDRVYYHDIFNWGGQLEEYVSVSDNSEVERPCVALWSLLVIFSDGFVPLCNVDYNGKYPTGDVNKNSIQEIWQNQTIEKRRALHLSGSKGEISLCTNCDVWNDAYLKTESFYSD